MDKGLKSSEHRDETWDSYMFRLINITNSNRDLKALKGLKQIWNLLDLKNISRLRTSNDALEVAGQIYMIIHQNVQDAEYESNSSQKEMGGDDNDTNGKSEMSSDDNPTSDGSPMEGNGSGKGKTLRVMMVRMMVLPKKVVLSQLASVIRMALAVTSNL